MRTPEPSSAKIGLYLTHVLPQLEKDIRSFAEDIPAPPGWNQQDKRDEMIRTIALLLTYTAFVYRRAEDESSDQATE